MLDPRSRATKLLYHLLEPKERDRFGEGIPELDTLKLYSFSWVELGGIPDKGDLSDYWIGISSAGDFLGTIPSYTMIRDPILRLWHRLIACSIAGRSQAPEKVIVTNLFYLRGMDVGSINVPYLLARYLRLFAAGRKSGAHIFGGQFVARLAKHFRLLTIYVEIDDTWDWVAMRPERQPDTATGAPDVAGDAPIIDEGKAVLAPVHEPKQPPPPPPATARTMP
ncbi:hypothetical protein Tco_0214909 [Tanacetum coccineum]